MKGNIQMELFKQRLCVRCKGPRTDATRRHCAPCILRFIVKWVAWKR